jgi:hypothetical protein
MLWSDGDALQLDRPDSGAVAGARDVQRGDAEFLRWGQPGLLFLIPLVPGCVVSYGTTILVFLPCLFLLSRWWPVTGLRVCLLGLVLGALVFVPLTSMDWQSSGPDSGPPTESFFVFFLRWAADPMTAIYPLAGLVTAGLYWWLGSRRRGRSTPAQE